jgi:hypothetical protein
MLGFSDVLLFSSMFSNVLHCFSMLFDIILISMTKCSSLECDMFIALIKTQVECLRVKRGANQYNELQKNHCHWSLSVCTL